MSRVVGDIAIDVSADIGPLVRDMGAGTASVNKFGKATDKVANNLKRFNSGTTQASRRLSGFTSRNRRASMAVQNAAFQMGDFAVQVGGGVDASRALAQQLPQLLGGFGVLGAVLGAVAAIAIPVRTAMKGLAEDGKNVGAIFGDLQPAFSALSASMKQVGVIALDFAEVLVNNLDRIIVVAGTAATLFAGKWVLAFAAARVATFSLAAALVTLRTAIIRTGIGAIVIALGEAVFQFTRLTKSAGGFGEALSLLWGVAKETFGNIGLAMDAMKATFRVAALSFERFFLASIARVLQAFQDMTWSVAAGFNKIFGTDLQGVIIDAISGVGTGSLDRTLSDLSLKIADAMQIKRESGEAFSEEMESLKRIRDLLSSMKDDKITLDSIFGGGGAEAEDGGAGGGGVAERLKETESQIQESYARIKDLTKGTLGEQLGSWDNYFTNLSSLTQSKNERLLRVGKAFASAQALIDAWSAHNKVLADPTLPWWARIASAAQVLGAGLGAVSAINNVSAGGGGQGAGAAGAASASATSPLQAVNVQLNGSSFSVDSVRDLINQINEAVEGGARIKVV